MSDEFEKFIAKTAEIALQQMESIKGGKVYSTLQSIGIFLPPETKPHILNRKCAEVLSVEQWEAKSLECHAKHQPVAAKSDDSESTITSITITRT